MNFKSQFVNGGLHLVRLTSQIVLGCYVILMYNLIELLKDILNLFLKLISVTYLWTKISCLTTHKQDWKKT